MSIGMSEIILILLTVVSLFGGKKIPELARALGRAAHEFKKAKESIENEVSELKETTEHEVKKLENAASDKKSL
jgi:sec-independent protein translocase protein TatA